MIFMIILTNFGKIKKGGIELNNYKEINDTRYIISRNFRGNKTAAMLIEQRVKNMKDKAASLEMNGAMMYNDNSGSIQESEVI